jgi:tetratricopeptide (TPR) repeat protein
LSGDESPRLAPSDPDHAAGLAAFERADWQGVLANLTRVVARRPWDDHAHNLLGYAYRKLGDYRRALAHYQQALDRNPHHRGALEYLGELYLDMGCLAQASGVLARLETACKRIAGDAAKGDWQSGCAEWQELKAAIDAYPGPAPAACPAPEPARTATP